MRRKLLAGMLALALVATNLQMPAMQVLADTTEADAAKVLDDAETLTDRALVAVCLSGKTGAATYQSVGTTGVYLSWRSFKGDYSEGKLTTTYTLYRDDAVIADKLTTTNFVDAAGTKNSVYRVVGSNDAQLGLTSKNTAAWENFYQEFMLYAPEDETMPGTTTASTEESEEDGKDAEDVSTGDVCTYSANDMSVGDLDGDGDLELIVKWYPSNARDNSQWGYTGKTFLDGYDINFATGESKLLWRIDMGVNIRSGAHYTQFQVWDYDGDGKAEIAVKTADGTTSYKSTDGTVDGLVEVDHVGACNADALPVNAKPDPERHDYRNDGGHIIEGPEYFSIFNGEDGSKAAADVKYLPERGSVEQMVENWGANGKDKSGNRSERYLSGTAYLDGENPYAIFTRGYYHRSALTAYYLKANENKKDENDYDYRIDTKWIFDTKEAGAVYGGQGNHGLSVNDVDGDGFDEIIFGALTVDHDGTAKYTTGLEHGDALHVSDWVSWNPGLEIMCVHEHEGVEYHVEIHDAATGKVLMGYSTGKDTGRGVAADVDPTAEGGEWWGAYGPEGTAASSGVYSAWSTVGNLTRLANSTPAQNFTIFWDGDLLSETLNGTYNDKTKEPDKVTVGKWNYEEEKTDALFTSTELWSNNSTKGNVGLAADILGDWREEIISRVADDKNKIRIYTTTIKTDYTVPCLLEDRAYREGIAWQNVGYNQPANLSYLLSEGLVTAQLSTKEPQEDAAQLLFTPASDGKYGHEVTAYEIYRADGIGSSDYKRIATVRPEELATEIAEKGTKEPDTGTVQSTEYYKEDFEGSEYSFRATDTNKASCTSDQATVNKNTSGHIYGVSDNASAQVNLSDYGITGTAEVSLDLRMDGCGDKSGSSFALLGSPSSNYYLSSSYQILTISGSASGNGYWKSISLNGIDITSKANRNAKEPNGESGSGLKRDTTGWMHLDATLHLDSQTADVVLKYKATDTEIYSGTLDFVHKGNMTLTALKSIFIASGKQYGGVYIDDITVTGTPAKPVASVTPDVDFYYVYNDTNVEKDKVYNYKVAAVVDGKTSFLSRPLQITTIPNDYIVKCDDISLEVEMDKELDVSGIETVQVTRLSGKKENLAVHWLDTTVDTTRTGTTKVGYTLEGEDVIRYASVSVVYPSVHKFDFGITPKGNTADGWKEIAVNPKGGTKTMSALEVAYSSETGYGFLNGEAKFEGRNDGYRVDGIGPVPKVVYEDYAMPTDTFAVDIANGKYEVVFVVGSGVNGTNRLRATMENSVSVSVDSKQNMYTTKNYEVNVADGRLDIKFTPYVSGGSESYGRVNAIIIRKVVKDATDPIAVTGVALSKETLTFETAETQTIYGTVVPVNADNKNLTWTVDDESVVTVTPTENGGAVVKPFENGTATITVSAKGDATKTKTCAVTVNIPKVSESETPSESESENPKGSESENPKGSESENPKGSESENPKGSESENPKGSESENPKGSESENPTGSESENPTGSESENPKGSESENPKGSETSVTESSESGGTKKPTPVGGEVVPKDGESGKYKVTMSGKSVEYTGPIDKKQKTVVIPDTIEGVDGIRYDVISIAAGAFQNNEAVTDVTIGNKVTEIPAKAFYGCKNLNKVKIGSGILKIGTSAFANCKKLSKLTMGKNVQTIGSSAFANCTKLKSISIPDNVASIGKKAFYKNTSMTTVIIGKKVRIIGVQAFFGCKNLKTVTIKSTVLKKVGKKAFKGIKKNAKIKLPAKKTLKIKYKNWIRRSGVDKVTYK